MTPWLPKYQKKWRGRELSAANQERGNKFRDSEEKRKCEKCSRSGDDRALFRKM